MNTYRFILVITSLISVAAIATSPSGKYKTLLDNFSALQSQYSSVSSLFSIGTNDDGVDIMAMRISTSPTVMDPKKIGQLIVAAHHGNEGKGADLALSVTKKLLAQYTSRELFEGNLPDMEWTIIPVLNISGFNASQRWEHGQDPNRGYPGPCAPPMGNLASLKMLMQFLASRVFAGTITIHGYIGTLTYPWGVAVDDTHTQDHNAYEQIVSKAAKLNNYRYGTSTDIVYPADGTYEDYVYWKHGIWSLLVELESGSPSDIEATSLAMLSFFSQLDSSPSTKNQLTSQCQRNKPRDLFLE